jgi:hypothetical protein
MNKLLILLVGLIVIAASTTGIVFALTDDKGPTVRVLAPIDEVEVLMRESYPVQYALRIVSGLPNGCTEFDQLSWERKDDIIQVEVFNVRPASDEIACTAIYGMVTNVIELGSDFTSGATYTIVINDVTETFVAQ